ncbi:DUF2461 domain-containing protein [Croceivirga sp. JEA036]|uniref:DUF2461 domain-containing protein n=1 Tax=Croceivirga sp. JEA036 TaxID=2721162 RepID=UPI00143AF793|nr:DUF2461 domain-containing protein [Croceivirga sp. JEA036]NJB35604.1 DUF2461 domain-containing protein [Croceivirga sp. JEA036]
MSKITKETLNFLKDLAKNNNREWFAENKATFKEHEIVIKEFYQSVLDNLNKHDQIEKLKLFRIYRDVRFSKDKTPYKAHFAGSFTRAGAALRGGYYLRIKPGESFIAAGFFGPEKEDLLRIRKEWEQDASELREILNTTAFKNIWGNLEGEELKTAPKGFDKEHPAIEFIRKKQYLFTRSFTDKEVLSSSFTKTIDESYLAIRPFFNLMSDILTTNLNGESLL